MRDLANGADHDRDGFLSPEECATVTEIDLTWEPESYEGIQYFTALKALTISGNTDLQSLDLRSNTKLERLDISRVPNLLTLDLSQNTELTYLQCTDTGLDSLNLTHNTKLFFLRIPSNHLSSLDLSKCSDLSELYASCCQLSSLVLGDSPLLKVPGPTPCVQTRRRVSLRAERASARRSW